MGMVIFLLVVVDQFDIEGVCPFETENNPPVGSYGYGPEPLQIALKRVQPIPRNIQGVRRGRAVKSGKNSLNGVHKVRPDSPLFPVFIEPLKPPMLETPNH
jgi:hypothetical protein